MPLLILLPRLKPLLLGIFDTLLSILLIPAGELRQPDQKRSKAIREKVTLSLSANIPQLSNQMSTFFFFGTFWEDYQGPGADFVPVY